MNAEEHIQEMLVKTAIADDRQYQITQAELTHFERELATLDRENPNLHPRIILGRINNFQRTIDHLKQELAAYKLDNHSKMP